MFKIFKKRSFLIIIPETTHQHEREKSLFFMVIFCYLSKTNSFIFLFRIFFVATSKEAILDNWMAEVIFSKVGRKLISSISVSIIKWKVNHWLTSQTCLAFRSRTCSSSGLKLSILNLSSPFPSADRLKIHVWTILRKHCPLSNNVSHFWSGKQKVNQ